MKKIFINQVQRPILVLSICISCISMTAQSGSFDHIFVHYGGEVIIHNVQQNSPIVGEILAY